LQEILDHLNDQHGRNGLLSTYIHFQACVPQESRSYGPVLQRPMSVPPQRKHSRSTSQPEVHANLETLALDAEVNGALRGMERAGSLRGVDPNASRMTQRKYLHEEISLLWTICNSSSRDAVFSNSW